MLSLVFVLALAVAVWSIVATVRPRLAQIAALFQEESVLPPLPPRSRATVRSMPVRMRAAPALRAAA